MNNEEIIKKAIEKAEKSGFDSKEIKDHFETGYSGYDTLYITEMIFSHDFAKAFWGELKKWEEIISDNGWWISDSEYHAVEFLGRRWHYHLQQMVLEEDPIKYLEQFLK